MLTGFAFPQTLDSLRPDSTALPDSGSVMKFARDSALADSIAGQLPQGTIPQALRWIFNLSTTVQLTAAFLGITIALIAAVLLWKRREALLGWFRNRWGQQGWRIGFITVAGVGLIAGAGGGYASWHYMEHANDFCVSCHVMNKAFVKFQSSEHVKLECHDCHKTSLYGQMKELYVWVTHKPTEIPAHAPVPNDICEKCHVQKDPTESWQRVSATAGHRIHLTSDSAALKDLQCTKCHGAEVHRFVPAAETCGQSQCHENLKVKMGRMSNVAVHCAGCHQFTAPVAENISRDSTRNFLVPRTQQCLACHEMRGKLAGFDAEKDPHEGNCGMCHNPHDQDLPKDAFRTCENSGCHARADTISAFHKGISPAALSDCKTCHQAHTWEVKGDRCIACHQDIFSTAGNARPKQPSPHRVAAAPKPSLWQRAVTAVTPPPRGPSGADVGEEAQVPPPPAPAPQAGQRAGADTVPFRHAQHRDVECTSCHTSERTHGEVKVRTMKECQSCHHSAQTIVKGQAACQQCHQGAMTRTTTVAHAFKVSARPAGKTQAPRTLGFNHQQHTNVQCQSCHTTPVTLEVTKTCASCHQDHHKVERSCRSCHTAPFTRPVHQRTAHLGCAGSGCHTDQAALNLPAQRNVCLTCHQNMVTHKPNRECAQCHQVNWNPTAQRTAGAGAQ